MAIQSLVAEVVTINSVDYSDHAKNATLSIDVASLDTTDFASDGWTEAIGGLKSATLSVELMEDVAASELDSELWALLGTVVAFTVKLDDAAVGTSNPQYSGSVLITQHTLGGSVGDLATKSLSFPVTGAVSRATS